MVVLTSSPQTPSRARFRSHVLKKTGKKMHRRRETPNRGKSEVPAGKVKARQRSLGAGAQLGDPPGSTAGRWKEKSPGTRRQRHRAARPGAKNPLFPPKTRVRAPIPVPHPKTRLPPRTVSEVPPGSGKKKNTKKNPAEKHGTGRGGCVPPRFWGEITGFWDGITGLGGNGGITGRRGERSVARRPQPSTPGAGHQHPKT